MSRLVHRWKVIGIALLVLGLALSFVACTGPEGLQGPPGPEGLQGPPGPGYEVPASITVTPNSVPYSADIVKTTVTVSGAGFAPNELVTVWMVGAAADGSDRVFLISNYISGTQLEPYTTSDWGAFITKVQAQTLGHFIGFNTWTGKFYDDPAKPPEVTPGVYTLLAIGEDSGKQATAAFELYKVK